MVQPTEKTVMRATDQATELKDKVAQKSTT